MKVKSTREVYEPRWYCIKHDRHITKEKWESNMCYRCNRKKRVAVGLIK